jgi:hypothetical protein
LQNRRARVGPSRGGSGGDAGNYTGDNGYNLANWVVTNDHSAIDGSGNPVDAGGFDSGGIASIAQEAVRRAAAMAGVAAINAVGRKAAGNEI